jgi:hypothetical protein
LFRALGVCGGWRVTVFPTFFPHDCAKKKVEKLRAAQGIEKHLFIWIPQAAAGIELAMATLGARPPRRRRCPRAAMSCGWRMGWAWCLDIFGGCARLVAGSSYSPEPNRGNRWATFGGARDGFHARFVIAPYTPGGGLQYAWTYPVRRQRGSAVDHLPPDARAGRSK